MAMTCMIGKMPVWAKSSSAHDDPKTASICSAALRNCHPLICITNDREKRDAMNKLWRSSKAIEANDHVGRYLGRRVGLTCFPTCLRTASDLRYQSDRSSFHPAMVAMVTAPDGAPSSLHRTYLTADGRKASVDEPRRTMPGTIAKGSAVRLAPPIDVLGIAEGIETALSASALFAVPVLAVLSPGAFMATTYDILHATGGFDGTPHSAA
jgi:hypothetical protein